VRTSSQHVEINLSELRGYEKHVLVSLINESSAPSEKTMQSDPSNCRGIWHSVICQILVHWLRQLFLHAHDGLRFSGRRSNT